MLINADSTSPSIARVNRRDVKMGRLYETKVSENAGPPRNSGNHPERNIRMGAVAHDQCPSMNSNAKESLRKSGIFLFFKNPNKKYGISLTPYAHLRCCLYIFLMVSAKFLPTFAS